MDFANGLYYPSPVGSLLTTTRASTGYAATSSGLLVPFLSNIPRITDLGLLVEQAATNLALQSQTFTNSTWVKANASVSGTTTAPDGTSTALKLVESAATSTHLVNQTIGVSNGTSYTTSIYFKAAERTWAYIQWNDLAGGFPRAWINLSTGALGTVQAGLTATVTLAANGFYRLNVVGNSNGAAPGSAVISFGATTGDGVVSYAGDGASGIYLWQADLVALGFPTSPIVTTTVAVTRAADAIAFKSSAGAIISALTGSLRTQTFGLSQDSYIVSIDSTNSRFIRSSAASQMQSQFTGTALTATAGSGDRSGVMKTALGWSAAGRDLVANNGTVTSDSAVPSSLDSTGVYIGSNAGANGFADGYVQRLTAWTSRLPSAQLKALTQ